MPKSSHFLPKISNFVSATKKQYQPSASKTSHTQLFCNAVLAVADANLATGRAVYATQEAARLANIATKTVEAITTSTADKTELNIIAGLVHSALLCSAHATVCTNSARAIAKDTTSTFDVFNSILANANS